MRSDYRVLFICFVFLLSQQSTPGFAMESLGIENRITVGLGIEYLEYEEHLPETALKSSVDLSNIVARVEGLKRWKNVFIEFQGVIPVVNSDKKEEWLINGMIDQTNSLKFGKAQFAALIGYPYSPLFNPYLGHRSTWSNQQRSDFRSYDGSFLSAAKITEKLSAHYFSLGFQGGSPLSENWGITFGAEYNLPYYSKVTNNGLPGWEAKNINGYLWNVYSELSYIFKKQFSISLLLCGGHNHWDGSAWRVYHNDQVKWPENDTYFINSFLNFNWSF